MLSYYHLNGGLINSVTLLSFLHNSVGYVTGNIVLGGINAAHSNYSVMLRMLSLVCSFLCGAIISGLILKSEYYHQDQRYDLNLILQASIIAVAMLLMARENATCEFLLALAMGLQNAMTTHYGTALIRTTHMTGTTTDLGVLIAHVIKGRTEHIWKIKIYTLLIVFFFIGALCGGVFFTHYQAYSLLASIIIYIVMLSFHLAEKNRENNK